MRQHPQSEVQIIAHGLLKLTLTAQGYSWDFLQVGGGRTDSGADVCH
jgi:hypothetical protein